MKFYCAGTHSAAENKSSKSSITCTELYNLINGEKPYTTLILDIRPKDDFDKSSMIVKDIVNIPEDIIVAGYVRGSRSHFY